MDMAEKTTATWPNSERTCKTNMKITKIVKKSSVRVREAIHVLGPLLLKRINFNPSMGKLSHAQYGNG